MGSGLRTFRRDVDLLSRGALPEAPAIASIEGPRQAAATKTEVLITRMGRAALMDQAQCQSGLVGKLNDEGVMVLEASGSV